MKRSTKATLLAALVYPGAGQLYLKKYLLAAVLFVVATTAIWFLMAPVVAMANEIAEKLLTGELPAGPDLMADVLAEAQQVAGMQSMNVASVALLGAWLVGIAHAWHAGRAATEHDEKNGT